MDVAFSLLNVFILEDFEEIFVNPEESSISLFETDQKLWVRILPIFSKIILQKDGKQH